MHVNVASVSVSVPSCAVNTAGPYEIWQSSKCIMYMFSHVSHASTEECIPGDSATPTGPNANFTVCVAADGQKKLTVSQH